MESCDEATAKLMGEALLNHAREISRYARAYSVRIHPDSECEKALKEKYTRNLRRMLNGMNALMLMARHKGVSRYCNREQIDAYIEETWRFIKTPATSFVQSEPRLN